ncbi:uncharacterized protein LOC131051811 isoform X2 [Cryptomeria japonica]|uniref:uncharacterized protein LOC131051811 isoform X2 n=1 Tax=Cryptomeria japonica TaxID=3369 RepID=UPI0025ACF7FE|nr:uncharacterized protein LOC131051811 isoform X2 [Cryptomeria japonica]
MAESNSAQGENRSSVIVQERITIPNKDGEKLVGLLDDTGSRELIIICHGFRSCKENETSANLASALINNGISAFRFDFSGNGESEGEFFYGNYWKEVEDLHAVVLHFLGKERKVNTIIGHSKGNVEYRLTKESLMDRLQTDMKSAALSISKSCRVLTIHGSKDEVIPVTDAFEFDKLIPNHSLHVIDEANHGYSFHQNDLASVVLNFIKAV